MQSDGFSQGERPWTDPGRCSVEICAGTADDDVSDVDDVRRQRRFLRKAAPSVLDSMRAVRTAHGMLGVSLEFLIQKIQDSCIVAEEIEAGHEIGDVFSSSPCSAMNHSMN